MTIKEVARLAGVSSAAVSRYLNGGPLSKEKKERVAKAIEETGYRPNLMAKTMRTGKMRQVGIIVPRIMSESVYHLMDGIAEELLEAILKQLYGDSRTVTLRIPYARGDVLSYVCEKGVVSSMEHTAERTVVCVQLAGKDYDRVAAYDTL